jgi:ankyrin repeat protein
MVDRCRDSHSNIAAAVDDGNWLPIHYAAVNSDVECVKLLIREYPSGLEEECVEVEESSEGGRKYIRLTPLMLCCSRNIDEDTVALLSKATEALMSENWGDLAALVDGDAGAIEGLCRQ